MIWKNNLKKIYFGVLKSLRWEKAVLSHLQRNNLLTVLNFHKVSPHPNPFWSPLHPQIFEDLIVFLKNNFDVVLFRELDEIKSEKPLVILSFDDGYGDFVEYAMPILEKHKVRANMNIIPVCVESGEPVWLTKLYDFLNVAPLSLINEIILEGFDYRLKDDSFENKLQYSLLISAFLKNRSYLERKKYWKEIEKVIDKLDFSLTRMMSRQEVLEILSIHEIGAHSFSHLTSELDDG